MKKMITVFLFMIIGFVSICCLSQEFVKQKTKKSYVSEQQDIELDGDIVMCGTQASGVLIELSKSLFLIIKSALTRVNAYACGEKSCLHKVERTERYDKKAKIKEKIEKCIEDIESMVQSLNTLIASLEG